jgi:hypothetical protein
MGPASPTLRSLSSQMGAYLTSLRVSEGFRRLTPSACSPFAPDRKGDSACSARIAEAILFTIVHRMSTKLSKPPRGANLHSGSGGMVHCWLQARAVSGDTVESGTFAANADPGYAIRSIFLDLGGSTW